MEIDLYQLKIIDSTHSWAKRELEKFQRTHITIITAKGQTAGRGRFNRRWISPVNQNVYVTFCFFMPKGREDAVNVTQVLGLALTIGLNDLHFNVRLKWPNDLLIHGRKVGGLLCELVDCGSDICVIASIGLNVNMGLEWIQEIGQPATSMAVESGQKLNLEAVYGMVIRCVTQAIEHYIAQGFKAVLADYRNYLIHCQGDILQVRNGDHIVTGKFVGIDDMGSLQLQLADGSIKAVFAGEVI
jgi:BirA family transcriptional regulator, biotin operon repressor / biotin---[acetyl-CoA-carboxylase] ligase